MRKRSWFTSVRTTIFDAPFVAVGTCTWPCLGVVCASTTTSDNKTQNVLHAAQQGPKRPLKIAPDGQLAPFHLENRHVLYLYDHPSGDREVVGGRNQLMTTTMIVMMTMLVVLPRVGDDAQ